MGDHLAKMIAKDVCEDTLKPAVHEMANTVKKAAHSVGHGLEDVAKNTEANEKEVAGGLRKYFIHDDGKVQRLENGGLKDLDAADKKALGKLVDKHDQIRDPSPDDMDKKWSAKKLGKKASRDYAPDNPNTIGAGSKRIKDPTELSRATEEARRATGDYGGSNYAALRYRGEDGKDVALVGRSGYDRSHSERSIGKPLLEARTRSRVSELYTEREPCQSGPNCNRWLGRYFKRDNSALQVHHGVAYDHNVPKATRDLGHKAYMDQLKLDHKAGNFGGTMGTADFDARGAQMHQQAAAKRAAEAAAGPAPKRQRQGGMS